MLKALPLGIMNYQELIENNYYAVDKTLIIKEFLSNKRKVTLITRPRRFGKTLNMSMMAEFLDITKDSKDIFQDSQIMETEYAHEMNQWPIIFISFAGAKNSKETVMSCIKQEILKEYKRYKHVLQVLDEFDQPVFESIKLNLMNINNDSLQGIETSLSFLMEQIEKYYQKR